MRRTAPLLGVVLPVTLLGLCVAIGHAGPSRYGHSDRVERHMLPAVSTGPLDPVFSPDGRWIAFSMRGDIWKVPAEGGTAIRLTRDVGLAQESADGTRLYYARYTSRGDELWSASVNGGDERPETGFPILTLADQWAPARAGVYYINANRVPPELNLFQPSTRAIYHVADLNGHVRDWGTGLSTSGDGRTLVYAENDQISADIMLVEDFR